MVCTNSIIIIIFYLTEFVRVNNGGERETINMETNSKCSGGGDNVEVKIVSIMSVTCTDYQ